MALKKNKIIRAIEELQKFFSEHPQLLAQLDHMHQQATEILAQSPSSAQHDSGIETAMALPAEIQHPHQVALFCDGACRGNPGPGSWGALGQGFSGELWFEASGIETHTTNNRMELTGAIQALYSLQSVLREKHLLPERTEVFIYTDSNLVVQGVEQWISGWRARGWKKADGKEVANIDLWQELDQVIGQFQRVQFIWVKGHAGHPQNERCDQLANHALDESGF